MKTMKKIAAVVLALAVIASFASLFTVNAADPENLALTATPKSNITNFFTDAGGSLSVINDGQTNGRTLGYWNSGNSWFELEFDAVKTVNHVYVLQDAVQDKSIRDFAVDVKLADGTWKRVAEIHHEANPGQGAKEHFYFSPVEVKEVRVIGNNAYAVDPNFFSVSEIEVYNDPSVTEDMYTGIAKAPTMKQVIQKAFADKDTKIAEK
jgi:hypothetical protein